jgi:RNA polymerase sigma factor (TIGR02999 family)
MEQQADKSATSPAAPANLNEAIPALYAELKELARRRLRAERQGHTLVPTALVNEAYLRLAGQRKLEVADRTAFFAAAAGVIRTILIDHARKRGALKRGTGRPRLTLTQIDVADEKTQRPLDLLSLDEGLTSLAQLHARAARLVELRFFGGLSVEEAAEALGVSPRTAAEDWVIARAWLRRHLGSEIQSEDGT